MKRNFISACFVALSSFAFVSAYGKGEKPLDAFIAQVKDLQQCITKGQPLTIDFAKVADLMNKKTTAINLVVPGIGGGSYTIELARYDFFSNDFEVHAVSGLDDQKVAYTPGLYYRGIVKDIPGSLVAFSFFNNEVYGVFSIPSEGNYVLVPNTQTGSANYNTNYILYNDNDITFKELAPKCYTDDLPVLNEAHKTTTTANNNVFNNCTEIRCFETVDYTMYLKKTPSSVTTSTNYVTAMFNAKSTIYKNEGIPIVLAYLQINTATDNYASLPTTSSSLWLDTFGKRTQNVLHGCDQATLFTTKGGTMGGVAWLDAMCQTYHASNFFGPYAVCNLNNSSSTAISAFPTYSWEVEVSTHEMGHNVGCPHTHACAWGPARNYAIDSCYTLEGPCIAPAGRPSGTVKGTIMSYCHLIASIGISFSNGFGQQPGDTVRYFISHSFSSTCGQSYHPGTALMSVNRTIAANRECTDMSTGVTYYWNDHLTAAQNDDTLVLMIKKNGNNIGNLDSTGFAVSTSTIASYGGGTGQAVTFPSGTSGVGATNTAMRRYWKITPKTQPTTNVEVIYPFTITDSADVDGSVTGAPLSLTNFRMYKAKNPIDPNPANGFTGSVASDFSVYSYGATASATNWSLTRSGDTCFAHMLMTSLSGGGTGFYGGGTISGIGNVQSGNANVYVYPNPTNDKWFVSVAGGNASEMNLQIYAADGKLVHIQTLQTGTVNTVSAALLPTGMYYYRVVSNEGTYTGSLLKK